ncbi:oxidoreductase [Pelobacter sp. M08fum]|uniref:Oxidoreductase n=1 Tax=Pelovirga terrestris TaxID=2771352 RepID=A0A8J6UPZ5_9BACT|nr:oxidoreductase [Pelovirga terrestris]
MRNRPLTELFLHQQWLIWLTLLPLGAAVAAFLAPQQARWIGLATALLLPVCALAGILSVTLTHADPITAGGWPTPLGIELRRDGLALVMLAVTALVGFIISCYALGYFPVHDRHYDKVRYFWPLWLFLWGSCNALFVSGDLFNLYVTLELVTLSSVALIALEGGKQALAAALRYLFIGLLGSLSYLLGVGLLYGSYATVDIALLGEMISATRLNHAAMALMVAGLVLKSALFPLHFWLPQAHTMAPAPVSAALSALVVKAAYVILLRLWFEVFPALDTFAVGHLLGLLGSIAIVWGSLMALRQERLKLLIAYSTVAQIGYLYLVFPLAQPETMAAAWTGGVLLMMTHACGKSAMFMVAGTIHHTAGSDRLSRLAGAGGPVGVLAVVFTLAATTIIGLPPSGGFFAKWIFINAALVTGQWWYLPIILSGTLLAAAYIARVLGWAFLDVKRSSYPVIPWVMKWPPLVLSVIALLFGLIAYEPIQIALIGAPVHGSIMVEMTP